MNKKRCTGCLITTVLIVLVSLCSVVDARNIDKDNLMQKYNKLIRNGAGESNLFRFIYYLIGFVLGVDFMFALFYLIAMFIVEILPPTPM